MLWSQFNPYITTIAAQNALLMLSKSSKKNVSCDNCRKSQTDQTGVFYADDQSASSQMRVAKNERARVGLCASAEIAED